MEVCAAALASVLLASCAPPRAKPAGWEQREFVVGLRRAPPQKPQCYAQAAGAGFNVIVDYVGPDALDLAHRHGLKLAVAKVGLEPASASRGATAKLIERFRGHPALWGYYLGDGVSEGQIAAYGRAADFLRRHDPDHPFFAELLPCDAFVGPALSTADYAAYLERFIDAARPSILCYNHYPFRTDDAGRFYFENLELVRAAALAHGLPFWQTIRASVWRGMRPLGEADLRWLVYTSLAYGAKGIVWFSYWGAPEGGRDGIVQPDGAPTERYRWVAALNAELRALGPALLRLRSAAVYHTGDVPLGATRLPVHGLVGSVEGGAFVVGVFEGRDGGAKHLLVANKDYGPVVAKMTINRPCRAIAWLDPSEGRWEEMAARADRFETVVEFPLPPGGGRLLRLGLAP